MSGKNGKSIVFVYAQPNGFSGQYAATQLLMSQLAQREWRCLRVPIPSLDHTAGNGCLSALKLVWGLLKAWSTTLSSSLKGSSVICLNLGQTASSFVREGIPFLILTYLTQAKGAVISLHGSLFLNWRRASLMAIVLRLLVRRCRSVTVLGETQRDRLADIGVPRKKIVVLPNACELKPLKPNDIRAKQESGPVRILFFSNLIDTKGYIEYLEALEVLSGKPGPAFEATICGKFVGRRFSDRFQSERDLEQWIEEKVERIGKTNRAKVNWIRGAQGQGKEQLFRNAHVFVFPSYYRVEAQPIVLLEAMASGCAIVTSAVGEIPSTLSAESAIILDTVTVRRVADAVEQLLNNPTERLSLSLEAHARFEKHFSLEHHVGKWETLLQRCQLGGDEVSPAR